MKLLLRIIFKVALFLVIFIACAQTIPYGPLTDLLTGNISLDMAIKISETVLGETYPEPFEFVDSMITMLLNVPVSIIIYLLLIKVFRHFKKP
ncbi:hypothetical protein B1H58_10080 [Pantoea alhagi]|uniref:Uncharacterized protein n=1 Tax=Pantoea alhagi TaxID=1891675 RepID=A0A1W6B5J8_9GAMM|nr:hypothetical protein [Pantoea alhagi]ARJ42329.1 hypothetical protein B1H58_10080 [Pantoea alhagi]